MKSQQTNPLRISHESLDLDDIISDLNEGNIQITSNLQNDITQQSVNKQFSNLPSNNDHQNTTTASQSSQKPSSLTNNTKSILPTKDSKTSNTSASNTTTNKQNNNSTTFQKTQSKSRLGLNKENTNKLTNQNRVTQNTNITNEVLQQQQQQQLQSDKKSNISQKEKYYLASTTTDTNTISNSGVVGVGMMINDRYGNSEYKFDSISNVHQDDFESVRGNNNNSNTQLTHDVPFYLQNHQQQPPTSTNSIMTQPMSMSADEDVESFQKKLDTLIINFRSETVSEFMRTKKQVLTEQNATIDAERRRCNTLLGVKQNEIEQLKEGLGQKTKLCDELSIRCEIMALWAGKGKTLAKMKVLQFKCFNALKQFREFKKHSKQVLMHKLAEYQKNMKRKAFQGWEKHYKEWKIVKNRDDFEKAVKSELQQICAQYSKEIESLRQKLEEANSIVDQENKNKAMMQENLKKAFMRGVCALNFEAMNILNPNDVGYQSQIEKEMEKQVMYAMNDIASQSNATMTQRTFDSNHKSNSPQKYTQNIQPSFSRPTYETQNPFNHNQSYSTYTQQQQNQNDSETYQSERKFMQIDHNNDLDYKKVETKDSLWKPAPIMGREIAQNNYTMQQQQQQQPQITQILKQTQPQTQNFVLPSHFSRLDNGTLNQQQQPTQFQSLDSYNMGSGNMNQYSQPTDDKVLYNQQLNYQSSSLPDFMSNNNNNALSTLPQVNSLTQSQQQNEGKTIYAGGNINGMTSVGSVAQTSSVGGKTINVNKTVAVNQTTKKGNVTSTSGTAKKTTK